MAAAKLLEEGKISHTIRWGADWNSNDLFDDNLFNDLLGDLLDDLLDDLLLPDFLETNGLLLLFLLLLGI